MTHRKAEQERQQKKRMRTLIWFTSGVAALILVIILLFLQPPKSNAVAFNYDELPVLGNKDASIQIVEFGDYQCYACQDFFKEVKPQLMKDYIDTNKASFYFMNYLVIGPDSNTAALAAQSVFHQDNDSFWKYYDALYENQGEENGGWVNEDYLVQLAKDLNLAIDYDLLRQDIVNATYQDEVNAHMTKGDTPAVRITGTPTFFVNGQKYMGGYNDYNALKKFIETVTKGE